MVWREQNRSCSHNTYGDLTLKENVFFFFKLKNGCLVTLHPDHMKVLKGWRWLGKGQKTLMGWLLFLKPGFIHPSFITAEFPECVG